MQIEAQIPQIEAEPREPGKLIADLDESEAGILKKLNNLHFLVRK